MVPDCPMGPEKPEWFRRANLARGLLRPGGMSRTATSLVCSIAVLCPSVVTAQLVDNVIRVGDEDFNTQAVSYVNIANCADPTNTEVEISLDTSGSGTVAYLWVGGGGDACQESDNRNLENAPCAEVDGSPQSIGTNSIVIITVDDLISTGVVDCEASGLQGSPYQIFSFRNAANEPPGTTDVGAGGYGIADFTVDVEPPAQPNITGDTDQLGSQFTVNWSTPDPPDNLFQYNLFEDQGGACSAMDGGASNPIDTGNTVSGTNNSISISANALGLESGDTTTLQVTATDQALNESDFSAEVCATSVPTGGFCAETDADGKKVNCNGCTVSAPGLGRLFDLQGVALLLAALAWMRRRGP